MKYIIFDIECDNLDPLNPKLVGFAAKQSDDNIITYHSPSYIQNLKSVLESPDWLKICHNVKFELSYLKSLGVKMSPPFVDTMVMAWILNMGVEGG